MNKITSFCDKVIEACWLAALVIAPLFINFHSSISFEPDKSTVVRAIALVMLAAFIIKRVALSEIKHLLKQPLFILTILLGLSYLASTFLSVLPAGSWWGSYARGQGTYSLMGYFVIFAVTALTLRDRAQLERIFVTIILTSIPVVTYGFVQKLKLDVLPWGADFSTRIASTMGNPIFLGSYLIMVIPLTIYLLIRAIKESSPAKSAFYIVILLAQIFCLLLTESRGPLLGLITAGFFFVVLSGLVFGKRYLSLGSYIAAVLVLGFFLALALPNTPFQGLKSKMGRLSQMLEAREGAAQVRLLIWQGVVKMVQSDSYRAVVGYGPETMSVPYYKYCPAELVTSENKITFPDRSHNELFDTVITNGLIGALLYLLLFSAIIFYAFKALGLVSNNNNFSGVIPAKAGIQTPPPQKQGTEILDSRLRGNDNVKEKALGKNRTRRITTGPIILIGFLLLFGLAGLVIPMLLNKTIFIAVGVPLGIVTGAVGYLFVCVMSFGGCHSERSEESPSPQDKLRECASCFTLHDTSSTLLLITLFSALIGHFVETQFGIDLTASRTYFYIYLAIFIVIFTQHIKPQVKSSDITDKENTVSKQSSQPFSTMCWALIVILILSTVVFDFIVTQITEEYSDQAMCVLVMLVISWASAAVLSYLLTRAFILVSLISAGVTAVFFIVLISFLPPLHIPTLTVTIFYVWLFINIFGLAWALTAVSPDVIPASAKGGSASGGKAGIQKGGNKNHELSGAVSSAWVFSSILIVASVPFIIVLTDINPIKGDIIYKIGTGQEGAKNWEGALNLYEQALGLSMDKGNYYGASARMCLEKYYAEPNPQKKKAWYDRCLDYLNKSIEYDALNPTRNANLGRFYRVQGRESKDPSRRAEQFNLAIKYYENACELSPQHPALRNELGEVYHEMGKLDEAIKQYEHSLTISSDFSETYSHLGDAYLERKDTANAVKNYYQAVKIQERVMPDLREQNQEVMFERTNALVIKNYPNDYRAYYNLGRYYANKGKRAQAIEVLEKALPLADEAVKPAIREMLDKLNSR